MKKERGSITIITLATVLFMLSFLISSFVIISNRRQAQAEIKKETKAIYENEVNNADAIYNEYFADENTSIQIYTVDQLFKIGTNEYIVSNNKIHKCLPNANYELSGNINFKDSDYKTKYPSTFEETTGRWINIEKQIANGTLTGTFKYNGNKITEIDQQNNTITHAEYIKEGLIVHYDGINNTGSGHSNTATKWKDLSENNNDGTLQGFETVTWGNSGLNFNGTTNFVNTALNPKQELGGNFTISTSINMTEVNNYRDVWGYHGGFAGIVLQCEGDALDAAYGNGSAWQTNMTIKTSEILNKTVTVTILYEQGKKTTTYINGNKIGEAAVTGDIAHTEIFWVGKGFEAPERYFKGSINNVLIYNRVLTESEIIYNYNIDSSRF